MAKIVETVPFSFDEIYDSIKLKFEDKGYDAIYEGSNTAQLITAMSYLTSMLNVNTAANINENILTLANKRSNILKDARVLGYEISKIGSYKYDITLTFDAGVTYTIPKYEQFTANNNTYYYMGDTITELSTTENRVITIEITEGELKKTADYPDLLKYTIENFTNELGVVEPQYYIDIPFQNVEENGIEVFLTFYDDEGTLHDSEQWTRSPRFMTDKDTTLNKEFVRIDDIDLEFPRIYFKLANVGEGLRLGTIVDINLLISQGPDGEMLETPTTSLTNCVVSDTYKLNFQGTTEETSDSIKSNAPLFHNSANRAVTKSDYISICTRHTAVKEVESWGGEDEYPKAPGHVWFSFIPSTMVASRNHTADAFKTEFVLDTPEDIVQWFIEDGDNEELRNDNKDGIWDILDFYKIPTLEFHNRNPIYIDFSYELDIIKYIIKTSKADIHQDVFDVFNKYFSGYDAETGLTSTNLFEAFGTEYFHSNLIKRVDTVLGDLSGFDNTLTTKIMLTSKNLNTEKDNLSNIDIFIPLSLPYADIFQATGVVDIEVLPSIDSAGLFGIYTDWSVIEGQKGDLIITDASEMETADIIYANIKINNDVVGKYIIHNTERKEIEIQLYVKDDTLDGADGVYIDSFLTRSDFNDVKYLDLVYPSLNFDIKKNCVPRLRNVKFL